MNVSYLMISFNRRDGLLANLGAVYASHVDAEVWVVDNASTDGTADAVRAAFPRTRLIQLDRNLGMPARNVALKQMRTEFVVLLDDDSHPTGDAVARSIAHMRAHREVGAVVGRVLLPDGRVEAPALPAVMLGGASCVRLRALRDVGFFPHDFFRQAEEYDLSLRLWNAGHRIERVEEACYRHDKTAAAGRVCRDVVRLDLKHNLIVAARYLPAPYDEIYWDDFCFRYHAMMNAAGHAGDYEATLDDARAYAGDARRLDRQPLDAEAFEHVFGHRAQSTAVARWSRARGIQNVIIADVSKNLFATVNACRESGLHVAAIADDRATFRGLAYRDIQILPTTAATALPDVTGVVISNTNPAQVDDVAAGVHAVTDLPTLRLWTPTSAPHAIALARAA